MISDIIVGMFFALFYLIVQDYGYAIGMLLISAAGYGVVVAISTRKNAAIASISMFGVLLACWFKYRFLTHWVPGIRL